MKKFLVIAPLLILAVSSFSQTVVGFYSNGEIGKKVVLHGIFTNSTYLLIPNDTTLVFDSSKVVNDVLLNASNDSIYVYKGGVKIRAIKVSGGSSSGTSIYTTDGSFTSDRFVTNSGFKLMLLGGKDTTEAATPSSHMEVPLMLSSTVANNILAFILKNISGKTWGVKANPNTFDIRNLTDGLSVFESTNGGDVTLPKNLTLDNGSVFLGLVGTQHCVWFGKSSRDGTNYTAYGDATGRSFFNTSNGGGMFFRTDNTNLAILNANGSWTYYTATATPGTPSAGTVVEWWDGTNKRWKKSDGSTGIIY